jgi:hypothetical protein
VEDRRSPEVEEDIVKDLDRPDASTAAKTEGDR